MTALVEETGPRKAESLFYTLAENKLRKLACRQVMGNVKRLLRRRDSSQQCPSALMSLGSPLSGFPARAGFCGRGSRGCLPLHPWDRLMYLWSLLGLYCLPLVHQLCRERVVWLGAPVRLPFLVTTFEGDPSIMAIKVAFLLEE